MSLNKEQQFILNLCAPFVTSKPKTYKDADVFNDKAQMKHSNAWSKSYSINDKEKYLEFFNIIENTQYQDIYKKHMIKYTLLKDDQREELISRAKVDLSLENKYKVIADYGHRLTKSGIVGYDRFLGICVLKHGVSLGYIDTNTFWKLSNKIARMCQSEYTNYEDYILSIFVGETFAKDRISDYNMFNERINVKRFVQKDFSPMYDVPWDKVFQK